MTYDNLLIAREGAVAVVTVNRPSKLNALDAATLRELGAALPALAAEGARAIVLTGAGEKGRGRARCLHGGARIAAPGGRVFAGRIYTERMRRSQTGTAKSW